MAAGSLMAFWLVLRTCKWEFIAQNGTHLGRYLWYSYYIPMVFVPLLGVFIIDHIGKTENYRTPNRLKYLYLPAAFIVARRSVYASAQRTTSNMPWVVSFRWGMTGRAMKESVMNGSMPRCAPRA